MALRLFRRKNIPDELPELISDEIESSPEGKIIENYLKEEEQKSSPTTPETPLVQEQPIQKFDGSVMKDKMSTNQFIDKSFFEELQENMVKEIGNLDKLNDWYSKKFLPRDIVSDMRGYWEGKKTDSIIKILGKNLQEKIALKIDKLQTLEKEWQSTYFELIEKEEEIRAQEQELKEILSEFVNICKKKTDGKVKKKTK